MTFNVQTQSALYINALASETTSHRPDARATQLYIVPCIDLQETYYQLMSANTVPPKHFYYKLMVYTRCIVVTVC